MSKKEYSGGYISLYRKMINWEWYDDIPTKTLFIHLLLTVNWTDEKWHGMLIKSGQLITSLSKLAKETGLTIKQVRVALKHLESTGEITYYGAQRYTLVTVENYGFYQYEDEERAHWGHDQWHKEGTKRKSYND